MTQKFAELAKSLTLLSKKGPHRKGLAIFKITALALEVILIVFCESRETSKAQEALH